MFASNDAYLLQDSSMYEKLRSVDAREIAKQNSLMQFNTEKLCTQYQVSICIAAYIKTQAF